MFSALRSRINSFRSTTPPSQRRDQLADPNSRAHDSSGHLPVRNPYSRPYFLDLSYEAYVDENFNNNETRPILVLKDENVLPWSAGYAECVGASPKQNEDQAAVGGIKLDHQLTPEEQAHFFPGHQGDMLASLRGIYFGIFDGHGGSGAALMASDQLINHLQEKLAYVRKDIFTVAMREMKHREARMKTKHSCGSLSRDGIPDLSAVSGTAVQQWLQTCGTGEGKQDSGEREGSQQGEARHAAASKASISKTARFDPYEEITLEELIIGAMEAAFVAMDEHMGLERNSFCISGGCCVLVALFIAGRLFVANAGDCRAVAYIGNDVIPMSVDFTPERDLSRIYALGCSQPQLLRGMFTVNRFVKVMTERNVGEIVLCKRPHCMGWTQKVVTKEDLRLHLVSGKGRTSRLMHTLGVSRSLGDFDLREEFTRVPIKPFISCVPEVKVLDLLDYETTQRDVLVMGCDGLWDAVTNTGLGPVIKAAFEDQPQNYYVYSHVAYKLVLQSRGLFFTGESTVGGDTNRNTGPASNTTSTTTTTTDAATGNTDTASHPASPSAASESVSDNGRPKHIKPVGSKLSDHSAKETIDEDCTARHNMSASDSACATNSNQSDKKTDETVSDTHLCVERREAEGKSEDASRDKKARSPRRRSSSLDLEKPQVLPGSLPHRDSQPLRGWRMADGRQQSSLDDITALVIPLHCARDYTCLSFSPVRQQSLPPP